MTLDSGLVHELKEAYEKHAVNGVVTVEGLGDLFKTAGEPIPNHKLRELMEKRKKSKEDPFSFDEFIELFDELDLNKSKGLKMKDRVQTRAGVTQISGAQTSAGTIHSMSDSEREAFSNFINSVLRDDADCKKYLPLNTKNDDLFQKLKDGILLSKLVNFAVPGTIDERALNKNKLTTFTMTENLTLAIRSCVSIGCHVVNVDTEDIKEGRIHLVLGLLWQVIKISVLSRVNIKATPNLLCMLHEGETPEEFLALSAEDLLLRWLNYQLEKTGSKVKVNNFASDLKDSSVYAAVMDQVIGSVTKHSENKIISEKDLVRRAEMIVENALAADIPAMVQPSDIVQCNQRLNMAFVAELFNKYPCLAVSQQTLDIEETREEKSYRNWMNSMGAKPFVNYLYNDISDGLVLLQLLEILKPNIVAWDKINKPPFKANQAGLKKTENCNKVVEYAKQLNFSLVGCSGQDIATCSKMHALGLVWQMMSKYTIKMLQEISGTNKPITESEILAWANSKLEAVSIKLSGFRDTSISTSLPILELVQILSPNILNRTYIKTSNDAEDKLSNAKYAISLCRKTGAIVYALPEDIIEVKQKMVLTIFACLMIVDLQKK